MTRVFVAGLCPLPFENARKSYAPGIRSWQFARGLASRGHEVRLLAMRIGDAYGELPIESEVREGVAIRRVSDQAFLNGSAVADEIGSFQPDAVVGATVYGSYALARATPSVPFWGDLFGDVMAEAQAKAALEGANWPLAYFWRLLQPVLALADRLSAVSERQRYALIGGLGAAGRLTAEAAGHELTAVIPCAVAEIGPCAPSRRVIRGMKTPEDAFVVLWSGSFNVWSDVQTLFAGVEQAMRAEPRIHFVSTGGAIDGHDETTYARFVKLVGASPQRRRFHLEGWVASDVLRNYIAEADLAVLAERPLYEGMLGSKNRIAQWMMAGLPVAYNRWGDLGDLLVNEGLGLTFPVGQAAALTERILYAVNNPSAMRQMAQRGQLYACERLSFETTTPELAAWCAEPRFGPDRSLRRTISSPADHATSTQRLAEQLPSVRAARSLVGLDRLRRWLRTGP